GFVGGEGVAVGALRRLEDAVAEGADVYAVILGSAIGNDGAARAGYTAPSADGQARTILYALSMAGVEPADIGLVEAHGSGTPVGDPIELSGLQQAFGGRGAWQGECALGSVKTNVGHLGAAAGVTALVKAALAVRRRRPRCPAPARPTSSPSPRARRRPWTPPRRGWPGGCGSTPRRRWRTWRGRSTWAASTSRTGGRCRPARPGTPPGRWRRAGTT